jgi:ubiquinone/menaquinone biosynthesis C-methylase UbiE
MPSPLRFVPMMLVQQFGRQRLERRPEPAAVSCDADHIAQYDRAMSTKLVLAYAAGLQMIHRARATVEGGSAIDLACGPGHFTLCLARYLGNRKVLGVDLSPAMVAAGTRNAAQQGLASQVVFCEGDATCPPGVQHAEFDLATFTDAAHHMPDLAAVHRVLGVMDQLTKPEGLVMAMDLARLRTARLVESYVRLLGTTYVAQGLPDFFEDFRNSMYAAWTAAELRRAIPENTRRHWFHIVPRGLPSVQVIIGLPVGRKDVFVRSGVPWTAGEDPVPRGMRAEWRTLQVTLRLASCHLVR